MTDSRWTEGNEDIGTGITFWMMRRGEIKMTQPPFWSTGREETTGNGPADHE